MNGIDTYIDQQDPAIRLRLHAIRAAIREAIPDAVIEFAARLQGYKTSKGAIQLPNDRELPLQLVADIARWSFEQNAR